MRRPLTALAVTAAALTAVVVVPFAASPAGAQLPGSDPGARSPKDTHCLARFDVTLSPGLSMTPSSGTLSTNGETGTNSCNGPINGFNPTGPGSRGEAGRYGVDGPSSCMHPDGGAAWTITFTMPTTGGPQHLEFPVRGTYGALQGGGLYGGTFSGDGMYGKFRVTVLEGDCTTKPITKVHLDCDEWIVAKD